MRKGMGMVRLASVFLAAMVCLLAGCAGTASYKFATGPAAKVNYGIEIYATDNVPFEYTELGIVRGVGCSAETWPTEQMYVEGMVKEAKALNADAVINVRLIPFTTFSRVFVEAQGVAVKIKRP